MYLGLYRKYRPRTFDDVISQPEIVTTLKNQIAEGQNAHAYLFTGSRGTGKTSARKTLEVKIPAGIDDDQNIALRGQGDAGTNGGPAGDLLIVVSVRPHEIFRREGTSVLCEAPITFTQAVLGAELEIPTIDGKVKYTIPEGTQSGTTFRLKGKGIPGLNGRGRGDQYVTVYIETPRNLNREQKEALKKFSESLGEKNYEEHKSFFGKFKL